jgi:hypothetical protein
MWIYTSIPHTSWWRSAYLVKYRDNFTFTLFFSFHMLGPRPYSTSEWISDSMNLWTYSIGLLGRASAHWNAYVSTGQHEQPQILSMLRVIFEPMIPVLEWSNTAQTLWLALRALYYTDVFVPLDLALQPDSGTSVFYCRYFINYYSDK